MLSRESAIAKYIDDFDIEVPEELVEEEFNLLLMNYRRKITYAQMAGQVQLNPFEQQEALNEASDEIRQAALHEIKEDMVFKKLLSEMDLSISDDELLEYAKSMAQKENTTLELIQKFFGYDFALLKDSIKRKKVEDWIVAQVNK